MPNPFLSKFLHQKSQRASESLLIRSGKEIYFKKQYAPILKKIIPHLKKEIPILDIGTGCGMLALKLKKMGFSVTPIDVKNLSIFKEIKPLICDGQKLPFKDHRFETGLLINVLHHAKSPKALLKESLRVCKKLIVHEDSPKYFWEWPWLQLMDSLGNFEFRIHPHYSPSWWKNYLKEEKLKIIHFENYFCLNNNFFFPGRYSFFVIENNQV